MNSSNVLQRSTVALAIGLLLTGCAATSSSTNAVASSQAATVTAPLSADAAFSALADSIWQAMQQQGRGGNKARLADVSLEVSRPTLRTSLTPGRRKARTLPTAPAQQIPRPSTAR